MLQSDKRTTMYFKIAGISAALCVALSVSLAAQCPDGTPPPCRGVAGARAPAATSVAVLPFENRSPDAADAYLADGMTDEIANQLSRIGRLQVKARTLVAAQWRRTPDPLETARRLNVAWIVHGSVRQAGAQLLVNVELVRAATGEEAWGVRFPRSSTDVFAVQTEVAESVAVAVGGRLTPGERADLTRRPTLDNEAYRLYLLGRFYWNKRTAPDLVRAADYFTQAIRADSNYAQAWSGLADSYVLFIPQEYNVPGINPDSILGLAERAARRALAVAPRLGEAWASLGEIIDYRDRHDEAGRAFEQGVALSPRYATAHQWYSYHLMAYGRWDDAVREMERARELDPLSLVITISVVFAYDGAERWREAEAMVEQSRALDPEHPLTLQFCDLAHDLSHRHLERIPSDYRRVRVSKGADSAAAADMERRLNDPARRPGAVRQIAAENPAFGVAFHLVYDGDDATIAWLGGLVGTPAAGQLTDARWVVNGFLGPRRRADPRFRAVLARLETPRP